jgi:glycosyl transferase family 1
MKKLLIVTFIDFWANGAGHKTRISSIVNYFKNKVELTVYYFGTISNTDEVKIKEFFCGIKFHFSDSDPTSTFKEYAKCFEDFIKGKSFDKVLVEYLEASFVLEYLPLSVTTLLDTHDILFEKSKSFKQMGLEFNGIQLRLEQELQIYNCFDYILLIKEEDYTKISSELGPSKTLLIPHAVNTSKRAIREKVKSIGYIGSEYAPNCESLGWFLKNAWLVIYEKYDIPFTIYGNIHHCLFNEFKNMPGVEFKGFIDDIEEAYRCLDIVINPIRAGAGLKIKNIEALGYGIPLITSSHGASGLKKGASCAYLIADTIEEFHSHINSLVNNYGFRNTMSTNAFDFAKMNFSPDICYGPLLEVLNQ